MISRELVQQSLKHKLTVVVSILKEELLHLCVILRKLHQQGQEL